MHMSVESTDRANSEIASPEVNRAVRAASPWVAFAHRLRERLNAHPMLRFVYRGIIGALGGFVIVVGIILVPLPGPGWLVIFVGVAILSVEFEWARRVERRFKAWIGKSFAKLRQRRSR